MSIPLKDPKIPFPTDVVGSDDPRVLAGQLARELHALFTAKVKPSEQDLMAYRAYIKHIIANATTAIARGNYDIPRILLHETREGDWSVRPYEFQSQFDVPEYQKRAGYSIFALIETLAVMVIALQPMILENWLGNDLVARYICLYLLQHDAASHREIHAYIASEWTSERIHQTDEALKELIGFHAISGNKAVGYRITESGRESCSNAEIVVE